MTTLEGMIAALAVLLAIVAVGSTVPVLPTGAAVSATAVVAAHRSPLALLAVVAVGGLGAYLGDAATFAICRAGGEALTRRLRMLREPLRLAATVRERLRAQPVTALLISRLIPGGRIPVLLTAAIVGLSWRTFIVSNVGACALWSATYAAIGLLGRSVFPQPWQGVVAAVVIVLVVTQVAGWIRRRREARVSAGA
ncbi:VTT domain-containing protein [Dactylosporangium fulvum]|uniref:VTT domain-containing protein n=1 Tax=Dactylosporangium fulvum TaxID=53359 RepID=A0ABY5W4S4_9ACTN|nr:VTT domain-containing protein [Dactylosporangium fulvum]UWP85008.1 VTT domain-containing protein [Dactylosporangium fulvum]